MITAPHTSTGSDVDETAATTDLTPWHATVPPVVLGRVGVESTFPVHVRDGAMVKAQVHLAAGEVLDLPQIEDESPAQFLDGVRLGRARFLVADLPAGSHTIVVTMDAGQTVSAPLLIAGETTVPAGPEEFSGRSWGLSVDLPAIRSHASWGIGDWADLADLVSIAAEARADFIQLNPSDVAIMPPSPFTDPIHIRPEDIREIAYLPTSQRTLLEWSTEAVRPLNTEADPIDVGTVWEAKKSALETIYAAGRSPAREDEFRDFCATGGQLLADYVAACAREHDDPGREEFYAWLQWIGAEQLERVHQAAAVAGMHIGLIRPVDIPMATAAHWSSADVPQRWAAWSATVARSAGAVQVRLGEDDVTTAVTTATAEQEITDLGTLIAAAAAPAAVILADSVAEGTWVQVALWQLPEAERTGQYLPAASVASVVTDTVPSAGFLAEEHLDLQERLGLLDDPPRARLAARVDRDRMLTLLREEYLLPADATERQAVEGLYRLLVRSPARLISVALADAVGERRPQYLPAAGQDYPSGRIPLADGSGACVLIDDLSANIRFASLSQSLNSDLEEL